MLILYKRSHVEYHGRFTARFLKRIQLGSPGLKTGLDKLKIFSTEYLQVLHPVLLWEAIINLIM